MEPKKAGRPTKYSDETTKKVCDVLRMSGTRRSACIRAGISEDTFAAWLRSYPDFSDAVKTAENDSELYLVNLIVKAAPKSPQNAQWLLSRRRSDHWGAKVEAPVPVAPPISDLSQDERLRRIEQLLSTAAARAGGPGPDRPDPFSPDAG